MDVEIVRQYAASHGWQEVQYNKLSCVVGFTKAGNRINVYYTTGTVGTCVDHPRQGKTQLFRRGQSLNDLVKVFRNPRVHTGVGYYRRHSANRGGPEPSHDGGRDSFWCCLQTNELTDELLKCVDGELEVLALGDGYFGVVRDGGTFFWDIPTGLYNKVTGRQKSLPPVDYAALGPNDYYYVQFKDGRSYWDGPDSLTKSLHAAGNGLNVELLAFAPGDGWYILWDDGTSEWEGLPRGLHNQLNGRQRSLPGVEFLSIGSSGSWFVRYLDGSWRSEGLPAGCIKRINKLKAQREDVLEVHLGNRGAWCIRY